LRELMASGAFREDLFYRLNGITIELPPLAARRDRGTLIRKCIAQEFGGSGECASIESAALKQLMNYDWPGNIRELRNAIRTALAICEGDVIRCCDLPSEIRQFKRKDRAASRTVGRTAASEDAALVQDKPVSFESAEREVLVKAIEQNRWVMSRVAKQLGISRNTLYRKLQAHRIQITRPGKQRAW